FSIDRIRFYLLRIYYFYSLFSFGGYSFVLVIDDLVAGCGKSLFDNVAFYSDALSILLVYVVFGIGLLNLFIGCFIGCLLPKVMVDGDFAVRISGYESQWNCYADSCIVLLVGKECAKTF